MVAFKLNAQENGYNHEKVAVMEDSILKDFNIVRIEGSKVLLELTLKHKCDYVHVPIFDFSFLLDKDCKSNRNLLYTLSGAFKHPNQEFMEFTLFMN